MAAFQRKGSDRLKDVFAWHESHATYSRHTAVLPWLLRMPGSRIRPTEYAACRFNLSASGMSHKYNEG